MPSYLQGRRSARVTPQTRPILNREQEMVRNAAGGYVFEVDALTQLRRFLILGAAGGTYYANEKAHVERNLQALERALREHRTDAVDVIVDVSVNGRAPRQDEAIFALARAAAMKDDGALSEYALRRLPQVARTGFSLFQFAGFLTDMRGWGVRPRKAVAAWYEQRDDQCPRCGAIGRLHEPVDLVDQPARRRGVLRCAVCTNVVEKRSLRGVDWLALQVVKYRQRDGWTHKRLLDLSHPKPPTDAHESLYQWALHFNKPIGPGPLLVPERIEGFQWAQLAEKPKDAVKVLRDRPWMPWEALRTEHTKDPEVVTQLIRNRMPLGALIRQLGRYSSYGVIKAMDAGVTEEVCRRLRDERELKRARVHPIAVIKALQTYSKGQGQRMRWTPVREVREALEDAFYFAFGSVVPSGKRTLLAIDVSGSMTGHEVAGLDGMSARAAAAAMALVTAASEPYHEIVAFSANRTVTDHFGRANPEFFSPYEPDSWAIRPLDISPRQRINDAMEVMRKTPAGATDVSLPMIYAQQRGMDVDTFVIYTDNESFAGRMHPVQALNHYRSSTGIKDAKLVVCAMTATSYSVADPRDPGMLDVVGFDTAAPDLISAFSRGEV